MLKGEAVLVIAAAAALLSMVFVPPSAAYGEYIDLRVLALLFCLMAVVAASGAAGSSWCWPKNCWRAEKI